MRKINETYVHEETGIKFDIEYLSDSHHCGPGVCMGPSSHGALDNKPVKKVKVAPSSDFIGQQPGFVLNRSNPEMLQKIGKALQEIGEFCEKL